MTRVDFMCNSTRSAPGRGSGSVPHAGSAPGRGSGLRTQARSHDAGSVPARAFGSGTPELALPRARHPSRPGRLCSVSDRWFGRSVARRLPGLLAGLVLFGVGIAVMADAGLGLGPWEVFHQGIGRHAGMELGTVSILVGIPVLLLWWPLGERPGIGTILNVVVIGPATNVALPLLPTPVEPLAQLAMTAAGVLAIGVASGLYLAADLGAGPRDGLMTGLHHRFGWSIRRARTAIELVILAAGFALGGTVGIGTLLFAFGIGPVVQAALTVFDRDHRMGRLRHPELVQELEPPGTVGE